ncbi:MAG: trigger factor [Burkholderiaceae bacterium]|jgi:trigger factor
MTADSTQTLASSLERKLTLTVAMAEVETLALKKLTQMGKKMKMPGFRPGKVPMKVVQQTYGPQAQSEAIGDVVSRVYSETVIAQNLRPAGPPEIKPTQDESAGAEATTMTFEATIEIYPEVSVPDRASLSYETVACEVTAADVDKTIETLRKQKVNYKTADRAAQDEDQVRVDFKGTLDGEAFEGGAAKDFRFVVGAGQMLPEFDRAVVGMKAGEEKTFPLSFPSDYRAEKLAGKTGEFTVTLHEVLAPELPALDDELAKSFGIAEGGLAKLRDDVEKNLKREVSGRCKAKTKQAAMDALMAVSTFDVPKALVQSESQRMADGMRQDMVSRGMNVKDAPIPAELFAEQATKRVRLGLLVGAIVRAENLQATEEQVRAMLAEMAESYEKPEEFIRWTLSNPERRAEAEAVVIEDNVVNWASQGAKTTTKSMTVDELMKEGNA